MQRPQTMPNAYANLRETGRLRSQAMPGAFLRWFAHLIGSMEWDLSTFVCMADGEEQPLAQIDVDRYSWVRLGFCCEERSGGEDSHVCIEMDCAPRICRADTGCGGLPGLLPTGGTDANCRADARCAACADN